MSHGVNDTIMKMVKQLKTTVGDDLESSTTDFPFGPSLKRSSSVISSNDSQNGSDLSTPSKRPKFGKTLDLSYIGSPSEIRRLRTDLLEHRNTISDLENRIQHMHNVRKQVEIMYENEKKILKKQHENDKRSIQDLETQLQKVRQRELELKKQLAEANSECNLIKIQKDDEIMQLEKTLAEVKEESRIYDGEENLENATLNRKLEEMQMLLTAAEEDAEAHKKLVVELEKRVSEATTFESELEKKGQALQVALLRIKDLEYAKENFQELQDLAKSQVDKSIAFTDLEKEVIKLREENSRLKNEVTNKLLLEEEVYDLKARLVNFKEQEKKLAALQAEQVQTELYLNEWRSVASGICENLAVSDLALPHLLRSTVERLQQQEITLASANVELESQLKATTYELKLAKSELEKSQKLLAEVKKASEQKQNLFHRMQKKLFLVSRERDSYRLQLDSYEKDLTMSLNPSSSSATSSQANSQRERIESLEKILDGYRDLNTRLETDLLNSNMSANSDSAKSEMLVKLQEEVEQMKLENNMLREKKDQLETQLENYLVGEDTAHGQVYHLVKNPLAECLAQRERLVEELELEIDRLKKKVKKLEDGLEASKLNDTTVSSEEVQTLKEQARAHEAQTQRLKDYFKSSLQEFRNVIYMLLGYKIDRTATSMYKLTSVYAERAEDQLCFQLNSEGNLNLLENDFSSTLEQMVNLHLRHQKSIPVFLSALTIDLFNNSTMATKTFS